MEKERLVALDPRLQVVEQLLEGRPLQLARRTRDRRSTERLLAFILQWDHLPDAAPRTAHAYATMWDTSTATAYRLLDELRAVFPEQRDPDLLLGLLWLGLSEP